MIEQPKKFIRAIRKMGRNNGVPVSLNKERGKGGHKTLYYGDRFTIVQTGKLPAGTYRAMCRQLGIKPRDLEGHT